MVHTADPVGYCWKNCQVSQITPPPRTPLDRFVFQSLLKLDCRVNLTLSDDSWTSLGSTSRTTEASPDLKVPLSQFFGLTILVFGSYV